jgi:hypothetical protein
MSEKKYHHKANSVSFDQIELAEPINLDARYEYYVKVGTKFAYRDPKSTNRYELSDTKKSFSSEVQAHECLRFFKNRGAVLDKQLI